MYVKIMLIAVSVLVSACTDHKNITPVEHRSIHGYSQKPLYVQKSTQRLKRLNRINEKSVEKITIEQTGKKIKSVKLKHLGRSLFYYVKTRSFDLVIDAKNGKIIKKEKHD